MQNCWNTLKRLPWIILRTSLKYLETHSKFPKNSLTTPLKLSVHKTFMKHLWYFIGPTFWLPWNTFLTLWAKLKLLHEGQTNKQTNEQTEWQCHFLSCSSQLKMPWYGLKVEINDFNQSICSPEKVCLYEVEFFGSLLSQIHRHTYSKWFSSYRMSQRLENTMKWAKNWNIWL